MTQEYDVDKALASGHTMKSLADEMSAATGYNAEAARKHYSDEEIVKNLLSSGGVQMKYSGKPKSLYEGYQKEEETKYDPNTGFGESVWNEAKKGVAGLGALAVATPGIMADVALLPRRGLAAAGVPGFKDDKINETPTFGGTTQILSKAYPAISDTLGVDEGMKPPSPAARYAGSVANFAGSGLGPSALAVRAAKHKALALTGEALATVGGGIGAEAGGDIAEASGYNRAAGEIPGGLAGGLSAYGVTTLASKALSAKDAAKSAIASKRGREIGGLVEAEKATGKLDDSLAIAKEIESHTGIPFEPTLAGRTGSSYIANLEQEVLGRNVDSAERAIKAHDKSLAAVRGYADDLYSGTREDLKKHAESTVQRVTTSLDKATDNLAAHRASIAHPLKGDDPQKVGQGLDAIRLSSKKAEKSVLDRQIEDVYALAEARGVKDSMDDVAGTVKRLAGDDANTYQNMPAVFKKVHSNYIAKKPDKALSESERLNLDPYSPKSAVAPEASFQEIHSLIRQTNEELAAAVRASDGNKIYYLKELKKTLDDKINKFKSDEYGGMGREFRKWSDDYAEFAKRHYEGVGGEMHATGKLGASLDKEDIVGKFFTPTGMDNFAKLYKNNPQALSLLEDGILSKFAERAIINGEVDPKKAAAFLNKHKASLDKIPSLKAKLENARTATESILEMNARLVDAKTQLSNGILAKIAKSDNPILIVEKALTDSKMLADLMKTTPEGKKAALWAISHQLPEAAARAGKTTSQFLKDNQHVIEPILNKVGPDHYKNIKTISEAIDMVNIGKPPLHPNLKNFGADPIEAMTGTSFASLVSQYRATQITRQSSPVHMATSMFGKFWGRLQGEEARKMQEFLLTSPEAAKNFAAATKGKNVEYTANKLRQHQLSAGVRSTAAAVNEMTDE